MQMYKEIFFPVILSILVLVNGVFISEEIKNIKKIKSTKNRKNYISNGIFLFISFFDLYFIFIIPLLMEWTADGFLIIYIIIAVHSFPTMSFVRLSTRIKSFINDKEVVDVAHNKFKFWISNAKFVVIFIVVTILATIIIFVIFINFLISFIIAVVIGSVIILFLKHLIAIYIIFIDEVNAKTNFINSKFGNTMDARKREIYLTNRKVWFESINSYKLLLSDFPYFFGCPFEELITDKLQ